MTSKPHSPEQSAPRGMHMVKKLPDVTLLFWIVKLLTTGMGETTSDYLAHYINPILLVTLGGIGLAVALVIQFSVHKYIPWVYW